MLSFAVLASSSFGNSSVVTLHDADGCERHILIDAGISPRRTAKQLDSVGIGLDDVTDIFLTHLDQDHFYPSWAKHVQKNRMMIHAPRRHRSRLFRSGVSARHVHLFDAGFEFGDDTMIEVAHFAHDAQGSAGFVIQHRGARLGWATDLGRIPRTIADTFRQLDALAIESNYDPDLQRASTRPAMIKRRITGGSGHLSNEQSIDAVRRICRTSKLRHIVALHLSQECNSPAIVRGLYTQHAPELLDRLTIAMPDRATKRLKVRPAERHEQMGLFSSPRRAAPRPATKQ